MNPSDTPTLDAGRLPTERARRPPPRRWRRGRRNSEARSRGARPIVWGPTLRHSSRKPGNRPPRYPTRPSPSRANRRSCSPARSTASQTPFPRLPENWNSPDQKTVARYTRDLAGGLSKFGKNVQGKDVDELMGMAQSFGRQQPLAFLGAAALAGFVASRIAGASAHRATSGSDTSNADQPQTRHPIGREKNNVPDQ